MTCHTALSLLDDYSDGHLDPGSAGEVEDHLGSCTSCRQELADTRQLKELLRQSKPSPPTPDYWQETTRLILARTVEAEPQGDALTTIEHTRRKRHAFVQSVLSLAASIAILVSAVLIGENRERSPAAFQIAGTGQPVYFTEALADQLHLDAAVYTSDDRRRLAMGMLLMGSPGSPGRLALIVEMSGASQRVEDTDNTN